MQPKSVLLFFNANLLHPLDQYVICHNDINIEEYVK